MTFDLEAHSNCAYDYVSVYDGSSLDPSSLLGTYCGTAIPDNIRTRSNAMLVNFVSDTSVSGEGFEAMYRTTYGQYT